MFLKNIKVCYENNMGSKSKTRKHSLILSKDAY